MERPDSPSSDRTSQRLDDLPIVDLSEVAIVSPDGEVAFARGDDDGDVVAPSTDELDGFRRRDGCGTYDTSGERTAGVGDGALHRRGCRYPVVDDHDVSPLDRHRRCVAAHAQFEIARPLRLLVEERRDRTAIIFFRVRRDDRLAGRRHGAERELGLSRVTDFPDDDDVEIGVERDRDSVRDDDAAARDAEDEGIALGREQHCK